MLFLSRVLNRTQVSVMDMFWAIRERERERDTMHLPFTRNLCANDEPTFFLPSQQWNLSILFSSSYILMIFVSANFLPPSSCQLLLAKASVYVPVWPVLCSICIMRMWGGCSSCLSVMYDLPLLYIIRWGKKKIQCGPFEDLSLSLSLLGGNNGAAQFI